MRRLSVSSDSLTLDTQMLKHSPNSTQTSYLGFACFALAFFQTLCMLTGRYVEGGWAPFVIPVLSSAAILLRFEKEERRSAIAIHLIAFVAMAFVSRLNGVQPYLPLGSFKPVEYFVTSLLLSVPIANSALVTIRYLSQPIMASRFLRFYCLVPATFLWIVVTGLLLTLPVGPLSDEGMILFMEGGCDWGGSNIYFFSKAGLLFFLNVSCAVAMRQNLSRFRFFVPHFAVAAVLIAMFSFDNSCDTWWYGHPQGNDGQLVIEMCAFALLGLSLVKATPRSTGLQKFVVILLWNVFYVVSFSLFETFFAHWSWEHTWAVTASLLVAAVGIHAKHLTTNV